MSEATEADDLITAIARELGPGEQLHVGANQVDVAIAAQLARRLWAPGLRMNVAGSWLLGLERDEIVLGRCAYERPLVEARSSSFWQARVFDDAARFPIVFAGGIQVDSRGNANLIGIREGEDWKLRGPGSAGLPTLTTFARRFYLIAPQHEPRFLVDRASAISVVGDPVERARLGLERDALRAVITPLARFEPSDKGLVLTELAAGADRAAVAERTGFAIVDSGAGVREREPLSAEEREVLSDLRQTVARNREEGA